MNGIRRLAASLIAVVAVALMNVTMAQTASALTTSSMEHHEFLNADQSLVAGNGCRLVMQGDGNLVIYQHSRALWSTATHGHPGAYFRVWNGGLYVQASDGRVLWSDTRVAYSGVQRVKIQSDCNVVAETVDGRPLWSTWTGPTRNWFNVMAPGSRLNPGQYLWYNGPTRSATFIMQGDGNLVLYFDGRAMWATGTDGNPGAFAVMQGDGNLVVYAANGRALFASRTAGWRGANLQLTDRGFWIEHSGKKWGKYSYLVPAPLLRG